MPELDVMTETLVHVTALHNIACESDDAEVVRTAMSALSNTEAGRRYMALNPIFV